ncbi:unnamed protein product [Cyclocybe aegerita]|uniref:Uncharacterized protein n=1 Tax=Cyclocybe aegerita TaxID=1973307 RepID=A0A8S0WM04_CYCAE|nr:unnamed protein product [Cyclocybe aegerita]
MKHEDAESDDMEERDYYIKQELFVDEIQHTIDDFRRNNEPLELHFLDQMEGVKTREDFFRDVILIQSGQMIRTRAANRAGFSAHHALLRASLIAPKPGFPSTGSTGRQYTAWTGDVNGPAVPARESREWFRFGYPCRASAAVYRRTRVRHGWMFIGFFFNVLLLGMMTNQIYYYYSTYYRTDKPWIKIFVCLPPLSSYIPLQLGDT